MLAAAWVMSRKSLLGLRVVKHKLHIDAGDAEILLLMKGKLTIRKVKSSRLYFICCRFQCEVKVRS